jgi:gliding motility-associated-like protein
MKKTCHCFTAIQQLPFNTQKYFTENFTRLFLLVAGFIMIGFSTKAQFTSTWALTADGSVATAGVQAANVNAGLMTPFQATGTGTYGTNGYGIQTTRANWPTSASDNYRLDFAISPAAGFDINFTTLTFRSRTSGGSGNSAVEVAYQQDGAGPWIPMPGTPAFPHTFNGSSTNYSGTLSTTFTGGHSYVIRMYVYWLTSGSSASTNRTNTIGTVVFGGNTVVSGPPPSVTTTGSSSITVNSAVASGDITPVLSPVTESGICWGTTANPDVTGSHSATGPLVNSGAFNINISGLAANTLYHYRAYAINGVGTSYGNDLTFTTLPPVLPTVSTAAVSNITAISAATGGDVTDDGGAAVTQRGVVWNTTGTPVITADPFTSNGTGVGSFISTAQILNASTTYHVRAYAVNSVGTAYGNEFTFTTLAPTPTLLVVPDSLAFGTILQGGTSAVQSYSLSGYFLTPAAGNITITAPPGYKVSLSSGAGFATSLTVPYTGGTIAATTIYVRFSPFALANYNKMITNAGGGAPTANVILTGAIEPVGGQGKQGFSNKGKDFWVGYGATEKMTGDNAQDLRFTFNNPNSVDANVTISIPNQSGFTPVNYVVPANSVITTNANEIPEGATAGVDARLRTEGVSNAGIHIVSDQPIVAYAHNITSQVYAVSVLFPTPTLGREYTSLNFTQRHNSSSAANRSYCFAIATEDNTELEVVLPAGVSTETHAAGTTFTQTLNKGEVLNLFGTASGETGVDLSGVKVRSVTGTTGCKPFAFFCGSGKITIDCSTNSNVSGSGDNLFQQMFPKVAWGYKYIVVPTQPSHMNIGHVRVLVDDAATVVKRNGTVLTGIVNNTYYEYLNSAASVDVIEADKPIMVAQYMTTHGQCGNANVSTGDPEMIYLSSVQQTIDTVSLVSSPLGNSNNRSHFINVTLKTADATNFRLDGAAVTFNPVANDPANLYSYAQLPVAQTSHTLTCPGGFNAIAYGVAGDESYGYNAGTNLVDLFSGFNIQNQYASGASAAACRGSQFFMKVTLAFKPLSIVWDFASNANLSPNASVTQTATDLSQPNVLIDSFVINGVQLYTYQIPTPFIYNGLGTFDVKIAATSPTPDGCNGLKEFTFPITVNQGPTADFALPVTNGCFGTVTFNDASSGNGGIIDTWQWNFGDTPPGTSTAQSPSYTYTAGGSFNVHLRTITTEGCYADTTKVLTFSGVPEAGFSGKDTACINTLVTFTDTSKVASGSITQWVWNFGDSPTNVTATTNAAQTHTYTAAGTYTATLSVTTSTGCTSPVFNHTIVIEALPTVTFAALNAVCNNAASFALTGGLPATQAGIGTGVYTGPGVNNGNFDAAAAGVGTQAITYTYTSQAGCVGSAAQSIVVSQATTLSIQPVDVLCSDGEPVTLVPNVTGGVFTGTGVSGSSFSPSLAGAGTFSISYSIPSNACAVPAALSIVVNQGPCKPCVEPPKAFTPNGDGFYDKWIVVNGTCAKSVKVNVYNRWGGLVYNNENYRNQWDGTYKGNPLPDATYYYVIEVQENNRRPYRLTGNVTIMR